MPQRHDVLNIGIQIQCGKESEKKNKLLASVVGVVFSVVFLAAGVICLVMGINQMQKIKEGKYVETQAAIARVETIEVSDSDAPTGTGEE